MNSMCDGSVAKPGSMLNVAIFDPWQRSLFSPQRTPGKEPPLVGNTCACSHVSTVVMNSNPETPKKTFR